MTKKRKKTGGINANDYTIAQALGDVQYGPQVSQIKDLYGQAASQKVSDINAAKQAANVAVSFANAQRPKTKAEFATGMNVANQAASDVQTAFGGLGAAADPYKAATAREAAGETNRLNEAKLEALSQLTDRAASAKGGRAAAINLARSTYSTNKSQLDSKLTDLLGQKGEYIAGQIATLANKRASDRLGIRKAQIGANATTDAATIRAKAQKDAAAAKQAAEAAKGNRVKPQEQLKFSDEVNRALSYAQKGFAAGFTRQQVAQTLKQGKVLEPGDKGKQPTPSFGSLAVAAANDMAYDGHISRGTAAALHKYGYKVSDVQNALNATDFEARGLREPKSMPEWQAKMRAMQAKLRGGDWTQQMAAALGI